MKLMIKIIGGLGAVLVIILAVAISDRPMDIEPNDLVSKVSLEREEIEEVTEAVEEDVDEALAEPIAEPRVEPVESVVVDTEVESQVILELEEPEELEELEELEEPEEPEEPEESIVEDTAIEGNMSRIILTPLANPSNQIGITFNLDEAYENIRIRLYDSGRNYYGDYDTILSTIEVTGDRTQRLHTYKANLVGLSSNSQYYYAIGDGEINEAHSFKTTSNVLPTHLLFFGDIQGYKQSNYDGFEKNYHAAIATTGKADISYIAGDIVDTGDNYNHWKYLDVAMADEFESDIIMTVIGNHDVVDTDTIYRSTFNYPNNGFDSKTQRSYYMDLPSARVVVWDTEAYGQSEAQGKWLEQTMAGYNGFKIVFMHRSVYPMSYNEGYIRELSSLFDDVGVDLVLSGHDHIYNRTTMADNAHVLPCDGVTYIVGGSGSGSKYYDEKTATVRFWRDYVYDRNTPVFTSLIIDSEFININAYSVEGDIVTLIDTIHIPSGCE